MSLFVSKDLQMLPRGTVLPLELRREVREVGESRRGGRPRLPGSLPQRLRRVGTRGPGNGARDGPPALRGLRYRSPGPGARLPPDLPRQEFTIYYNTPVCPHP